MFDFQLLAQLLINGALLGGVYALVAVGLNLIFGVIRVINIAHGEIVMLGGFGAFWVWRLLGLNPLFALPLVAIVFFALGYLFQARVVHRLIGARTNLEDSSLLLTYGLSLALIAVARWLWTTDYRSVPSLGGSLMIGEFLFSFSQLTAFLVALILTAGLLLFLRHNRIGMAIRATAQNRDLAATCGVRVRQVYATAFGVGTAMAAMAGTMLSTMYAIYPEMGLDYSIRAFVIVILGGLGSITGAFIGALALGIVESIGSFYLGSLPATILPFLLILAILMLRPSGILGALGRQG